MNDEERDIGTESHGGNPNLEKEGRTENLGILASGTDNLGDNTILQREISRLLTEDPERRIVLNIQTLELNSYVYTGPGEGEARGEEDRIGWMQAGLNILSPYVNFIFQCPHVYPCDVISLFYIFFISFSFFIHKLNFLDILSFM